MDRRHRRIGLKYYLCPTAQARSLPLHCIRRLGTHAHGRHPHSWGRGCTGPPPQRSFPHNTDGCYDHCNPPSRENAVGAARMPHSRHAKNFARKLLSFPLDPPRHDPTPGRLPGVWQALQLLD
ncbi:hypothetical protein TcG_10304 [Trypanosoma cruzi]|nr:hypothetical protein TcG_10304 [Trypanosoma cruzi]